MSKQPFTAACALKNADLVVAGICLILLSALTIISVFTRYFLNEPFMFLEEVQKALLLWITMLAGCACFRYKQHVMIEIIVDQMSEKYQRYMRYFMVAVVCAVLAFMAVNGVKMCYVLGAAGRTTNVLAIPLWFIYAIVPVACVAMIWQCIRAELLGITAATEDVMAADGAEHNARSKEDA